MCVRRVKSEPDLQVIFFTLGNSFYSFFFLRKRVWGREDWKKTSHKELVGSRVLWSQTWDRKTELPGNLLNTPPSHSKGDHFYSESAEEPLLVDSSDCTLEDQLDPTEFRICYPQIGELEVLNNLSRSDLRRAGVVASSDLLLLPWEKTHRSSWERCFPCTRREGASLSQETEGLLEESRWAGLVKLPHGLHQCIPFILPHLSLTFHFSSNLVWKPQV